MIFGDFFYDFYSFFPRGFPNIGNLVIFFIISLEMKI